MDFTLPKCKDHPNHTCEFLCRQCRAVICGKCLINSHNKHFMEDLEDVWKSKKEIIEKDREVVTLYRDLEENIALEEEEMKKKYESIENDIIQHGKRLEEAVRKAKDSYLERLTEKKKEEFILLKKQKDVIKNNLEKVRKMDLVIPDSRSTSEEILAFCTLDVKPLPEVPKLKKTSPPDFVPNMNLLEGITENFANLAI
ncbi:E3 ubiquitin-protein ligase rnf168-like [Saccostrea cucullata]|uniref:E3 ubiquitin-protein ligase rnf168-like n=1 Tax=Saccostrea cuccullata TaxID=36930 RepID=UPI002ED63DAD